MPMLSLKSDPERSPGQRYHSKRASVGSPPQPATPPPSSLRRHSWNSLHINAQDYDPSTALRELIRDGNDLCKMCEHLGDIAEVIELRVDAIVQIIRYLLTVVPGLEKQLRSAPALRARLLREAAPPAAAVGSVTVVWDTVPARRPCIVVMDGRTIRLPRMPGLLLSILVDAAKDAASDTRDGWRSREEVRRELSRKTNSSYGKRALETLLWRLETELGFPDCSWSPIQRRAAELRFAMEKPVVPRTPSSPPVPDPVHQ